MIMVHFVILSLTFLKFTFFISRFKLSPLVTPLLEICLPFFEELGCDSCDLGFTVSLVRTQRPWVFETLLATRALEGSHEKRQVELAAG